ncbi:MAG: hypothetical protein AB1489_35880 [Acidobacteriota bacterium]
MNQRQARKTINDGSQREPGSTSVGYCRETASRTQEALVFMPELFTQRYNIELTRCETHYAQAMTNPTMNERHCSVLHTMNWHNITELAKLLEGKYD